MLLNCCWNISWWYLAQQQSAWPECICQLISLSSGPPPPIPLPLLLLLSSSSALNIDQQTLLFPPHPNVTSLSRFPNISKYLLFFLNNSEHFKTFLNNFKYFCIIENIDLEILLFVPNPNVTSAITHFPIITCNSCHFNMFLSWHYYSHVTSCHMEYIWYRI